MSKAEKIEIILLIIAAISFFLIIGIVGGIENDLMTLGEFIKWEILLIITLLLSCGGVKFIEERY